MRKRLVCGFILGLIIITVAAGCKSGGSGAPTDSQAMQAISDHAGATNVKILGKSECELSDNKKAEGITERWVIRFTATDVFGNEMKETSYTIQKVNGKWAFWRGIASCGP